MSELISTITAFSLKPRLRIDRATSRSKLSMSTSARLPAQCPVRLEGGTMLLGVRYPQIMYLATAVDGCEILVQDFVSVRVALEGAPRILAKQRMIGSVRSPF